MGMQRSISVYTDTSVFGGVFDDEFKDPSKTFIEAIKAGRFILVTSELVRQEIAAGPKVVGQLFEELLSIADIATDALHVALATISGAYMIVSWNFRHIVNYQKIPKYNAVNKLHGYSDIAIYSPLEVIEHEDEDL